MIVVEGSVEAPERTPLEDRVPFGGGSTPVKSHFGVGAPILVYFSGDWDVHWGYGILTHGH